jgi:hypothetical protein
MSTTTTTYLRKKKLPAEGPRFPRNKNAGQRPGEEEGGRRRPRSYGGMGYGTWAMIIAILAIVIAILVLVIINFSREWAEYDHIMNTYELRHSGQDNGGECIIKYNNDHKGTIIAPKHDKASCNAICYNDTEGLCRTYQQDCEFCSVCIGQNCSGVCTVVDDCPDYTFADDAAELLDVDAGLLEFSTVCQWGVCVHSFSEALAAALTFPNASGSNIDSDFCLLPLNQSDPVIPACVIASPVYDVNSSFINCQFVSSCAIDANLPTYAEVLALPSSGHKTQIPYVMSLLFHIFCNIVEAYF